MKEADSLVYVVVYVPSLPKKTRHINHQSVGQVWLGCVHLQHWIPIYFVLPFQRCDILVSLLHVIIQFYAGHASFNPTLTQARGPKERMHPLLSFELQYHGSQILPSLLFFLVALFLSLSLCLFFFNCPVSWGPLSLKWYWRISNTGDYCTSNAVSDASTDIHAHSVWSFFSSTFLGVGSRSVHRTSQFGNMLKCGVECCSVLQCAVVCCGVL